MGPENGMNPALVKYFSLDEYVDRIQINDNVLAHLEETNKEFDKYLTGLAQFDDYAIIHYWIESLSKEIKSSQKIENHLINPSDMLKNDVFFDTLQMSHARIKRLHQFAIESDKLEDYRNTDQEVRVSAIDKFTNEEYIYWHGAQGKDVKKFMDDFIKIYKSNSLSLVHSNPFLKSALACLLFIRIHPFTDGNGRTGRLIYNIKFTDSINKIYGTKLKLCPLNISQGIFMYKPTYARKLDNIYFDLEHDNNDEINEWFDFILSRADEAIFFNTNRVSRLENNMQYVRDVLNKDKGDFSIDSTKMNLQKIRK